MKKLTALTVALMMSAGVAMAASHIEPAPMERGGKHHHGKMHGKKDGLPFGFAELNLSDEQKAKIKAIMEADRPQSPRNDEQKIAQWQKRMENQREQERNLMSHKHFDENAARKMIAQRQQEREQQRQQNGERELQMLKKRHAVFQVLTPEQQQQYQANQEKKMAEMAKRHAERPMFERK
ncbi:Spy/CpxP family protein refolding chaperone [Alysiella filiformis]|uniref:LTXXQ motif family protein n=1 Tax=Alysiella filiformis DSM 16848 TaxID=1120981 RepID=A0A286ERS5_9NEIS|nr:Spy/CpxP family protein refolding chaperone [Alysiella filiformis]QMT31730.1 Spy/CpxP family protein refolding chaperone [Alysiella filiformis]UBQ55258.1 Spy/CpxP family protein refolding chaperone [Alysiella filiformis DSM 16848]SOD73631.1 LTXXQ motif family protein [Alysiella filiformis DSM 16848]